MADLDALRLGLAVTLGQAERHDADSSGLTGDDRYLATTDTLPDAVNPPCAVVALGPGTLDEGFFGVGTGMDHVALKAILYTGRTDEVAAEHAFNLYLSSSGPCSIDRAIAANRNLGGACDRITMTGWGEPGEAVVGEIPYLAVELNFVALCSP